MQLYVVYLMSSLMERNFDSRIRVYLNEGKVVYEYLPTLWDVNPKTLEKRLSKDDYPPYISKEV